ncbi:hypothetical protein GQ600_20548 [Phytophthora cactorum]|nr:hypothetical protein GQ600_20548 [Phytophthora cactorum]
MLFHIFRPSSLEDVNLYEFTMWFFRKKKEKGHPLHSTHALGKRHEEVVSVIHGSSPSHWSRFFSREVVQTRSTFAGAFPTIRHLNDLIAFPTWKCTCCKFVETILDNMDDFYSGVDRSKCQSDGNINPGVAPGVSGPENDSADEDDNLFHGENFDMDEGDILVDDCTMDENLRSAWDFEADENTILDISALDPASCPTWPSPDLKIVSMLDLFS